MKKTTITLNTLLNLMEYLEKEISNRTEFVLRSNAILTEKKTTALEEKVRENFNRRTACINQLQVFKLAKSIANTETDKGTSNNARIYKLSDLNRDKKFISTLLAQKLKSRVKGKIDAYSFFVPKKELEDQLIEIEAEITKLKEDLSEFNESYEIKVEINPDLELI